MKPVVKIDPLIISSTIHKRPVSFDVHYINSEGEKPVVVHVHGFKGFKDWGYFNLMAEYFARAGFIFVKINFSHNGVTPESPLEFVDLNAFGRNNFSIEQSDLGLVIDCICSQEFPVPDTLIDRESLFITGHSRGGAAAIIKGYSDDRVKAVATWAGVNDLSNYFSKPELEKWEKEGVTYVQNSRTGQRMPLYYQIVEDYIAGDGKFDVPSMIRNFPKPLLVAHGTADETVPFQAAYQAKKWNPKAELFLLEGADHVFGGIHPWEKDKLPVQAQEVTDRTIEFFRRNL